MGQAVTEAGLIEMCHADTVNAKAQAGCRLLAKPLLSELQKVRLATMASTSSSA
jgi:hypothetical protein